MSGPLSLDYIETCAELEALLAKATDGLWSSDPANGDFVSGPRHVAIPYACKPEDRALIIALQNTAPSLIATIRHLSEALRPFANADIDISGTAAIGVTAGDILAARAALNSGEG